MLELEKVMDAKMKLILTISYWHSFFKIIFVVNDYSAIQFVVLYAQAIFIKNCE